MNEYIRQALHIFRKDVRYLPGEIGLVLLLTAALMYMVTRPPMHTADTSGPELLMVIAAVFLITRLVHAETLPGQNQYWITRPYRWQSLLGAKLLFIAIFVSLPIFLMQLAAVLAGGFPLLSSFPGLLWSQLLLILCLFLPAAALAAVTSGLGGVMIVTMLLLAVAGATFQWLLHSDGYPMVTVGWVRSSIAVFVSATIAPAILYLQYRGRRTRQSRILGLAGIALLACAYLLLPWEASFEAQLKFSPSSSSLTLPRIDFEPSLLLFRNVSPSRIDVDLPVKITNIPAGADVRVDALSVMLRMADGRYWKPPHFEPPALTRKPSAAGEKLFYARLALDPAFFESDRKSAVTVRASLYYTLFGNARSATIPIQNRPVNTIANLQCYAGDAIDVRCRSVFRWPALLVASATGDGSPDLFTQFISYSPFPAEIQLAPIETHWSVAPPPINVEKKASVVTITVKEPLGHFRKDVNIDGVHLVDFVNFNPGIR